MSDNPPWLVDSLCFTPVPGVRLQVHRVPAGEPAALALCLACGSHDEPSEWLGMAHFMEHLVFRGSRNFAAADSLMPCVLQAGGRVNARTSARQTVFHFEVQAGAFLVAVERLVDMLLAPEFAADSLASEREVLHQEHGMYSRMPLAQFQASAGALLQGEHPAQLFRAGNRDTLGIEHADFAGALLAYHHQACIQSPLEIALALPPELSLEAVQAVLLPLLQQPRSDQSVAPPALQLPAGQQGCLRVSGAGTGWLVHLALNQEAAGLAALAQQMNLAFASMPGLNSGWQCLPAESFAGQGLLSLWLPGEVDIRQRLADLAGWLQSWQAHLHQPEVVRIGRQALQHGWLMASPLEQAMLKAGGRPVPGVDEAVLRTLDRVLGLLQAGDCAVLEVRDESVAVNLDPGLPLALELYPAEQVQMAAMPEVKPWAHPLATWLQEQSGTQLPGQLRLLCPADWPDSQGRLYWVWQLQPGSGQLAHVQGLLAPLARAWEPHGVAWQLDVWPGRLVLAIRSPVDCMGAVLNSLLSSLDGVQLPEDAGALVAPPSGGFALRRMLQMLPAVLSDSEPQPSCRLADAAQAALWLGATGDRGRIDLRWLNALRPSLPVVECLSTQAGWHDLSAHFAGGEECLLVAYCPAENEQQAEVWRCLAPLLEPVLQQSLRSEQGLCYAVFARHHDQAGQQGLALALQSASSAAGPLLEALWGGVAKALQQLQQQPQQLLEVWAQGQQGALTLDERAGKLFIDWLTQVCNAQQHPSPPLELQQLPALLEPLGRQDGWHVLANAPAPQGFVAAP